MFYCGYVYCLLCVREWFVETLERVVCVACSHHVPQGRHREVHTRDALRASVYPRALPMGVRAQVCLVFVACIALLCVYVCVIWLLGDGLESEVGLLLYG